MRRGLGNGFRMTGHTFAQARTAANDLRARLGAERQLRGAAILADIVAAEVDSKHVGSTPMPGPPYDAALARVAMRIEDMRRHNRRAPRHDLSMEIVLMRSGRDIYGISYAEPVSWHATWLQTAGVEAYAYWGSGSAPIDVGPDEWENRGKTWRRIMPTGVPSMHGEMVTVFGTSFTATPTEVENMLPTMDERRHRIARVLAFQEASGSGPVDYAGTADTARWLDGPDGREDVRRRAESLPELDHIDATTMRSR